MITWMQKHNKYLVWTIWVATIAFIGAGFVGWGSYKYGSKASAVGKVGDIEITHERLSFTYNNLYNRYNELFKGKFDEEQAKKLGLTRQAFKSLATQGQLLNLAKQYGIIVSDDELANYIAHMPAFQDKGLFSKEIYKTYLQNHRLKSSTFESILADELKVQKLLHMLEYDSSTYENQVIAAALSIEDKIAYQVISAKDVNISVSDKEIHSAWEVSKNDYLTPKSYKLTIYWTDTQGIDVNQSEIESFYDKNSFEYLDTNGKQLTLDEAKTRLIRDLKLKKGKKQALLAYIAIKKGKSTTSSESITLPINDNKLSKDLWSAITQNNPGTLIKPKPVGNRYATIKIEKTIEPKPMSYDQAKNQIKQKLLSDKAQEAVETYAKKLLNEAQDSKMTTSDYLSLTKMTQLTPLNQQESLQFIQKLFTSSGKKGIIRLSKRLVVYKLLDQRMGVADNNLTADVQGETSKLKRDVFEGVLFRKLNNRFPVETFVKGL